MQKACITYCRPPNLSYAVINFLYLSLYLYLSLSISLSLSLSLFAIILKKRILSLSLSKKNTVLNYTIFLGSF